MSETRLAARVLLVNEHDQTLLFEEHDPARPEAASWWITPGGGIEAGETFVEAAFRELEEETGQRAEELYGPVLRHEFEYSYLGVDTHQSELFFVAFTESDSLSFDGWTPLEQTVTRGAQWWSLTQIEDTEHTVYPAELARVLRSVCSRRSDLPRVTREADQRARRTLPT